jgi:GrpB-like predicted nucleotidyltransferase (UPF0157 family)
LATLPAVDAVRIVDYNSRWPEMFRDLGARLRTALGDVALRIDHIGSTAVPGLAAKPIIDVQISVLSLEPTAPFREPLERLEFVFQATNTERTKRYFRESPGERRTHIHVRRSGSFSEQFPLLFRDYLRTHPGESDEYARRKRVFAEMFEQDRARYTEAKGPLIWEMVRRADEWAQRTGLEPPPTDA